MRNLGLEVVAKVTILKAYSSLSGTSWVPLGTAIGVLTSDNTAPADGATVTIGNTTYTFKTTLSSGPAVQGEVLINTTADAALLNLIRAINHTGTPDTDYTMAAAHTQVAAAPAVAAHQMFIVALDWSAAGADIATTETSTHLAWDAATLTGGPVECAQIAVRNDTGTTLEFGRCAVGDSTPAGATFKLPTAFAWTFRGLKEIGRAHV